MSADKVSRPLCLFGIGGHGRVVAAQIRRLAPRELFFADECSSIPGMKVSFTEISSIKGCDILVTVGDNELRQRLQEKVQPGDVAGPLVIEPTHCFAATIGSGSQVLAGAIINIGAIIGDGVIINSGAILEHDTKVGDFSHCAPGSVLGGGAHLGAFVMLGSNATVLPNVSVVSGSVIGAGAVVTSNIVNPGIYVGVPARRRDRPAPSLEAPNF